MIHFHQLCFAGVHFQTQLLCCLGQSVCLSADLKQADVISIVQILQVGGECSSDSPSAVVVTFISQSMATVKRNGDKMHPFFTPVVVLKLSVSWLLQITLHSKSLYRSFMIFTIFWGIPYDRRIFQSDS